MSSRGERGGKTVPMVEDTTVSQDAPSILERAPKEVGVRSDTTGQSELQEREQREVQEQIAVAEQKLDQAVSAFVDVWKQDGGFVLTMHECESGCDREVALNVQRQNELRGAVERAQKELDRIKASWSRWLRGTRLLELNVQIQDNGRVADELERHRVQLVNDADATIVRSQRLQEEIGQRAKEYEDKYSSLRIKHGSRMLSGSSSPRKGFPELFIDGDVYNNKWIPSSLFIKKGYTHWEVRHKAE